VSIGDDDGEAESAPTRARARKPRGGQPKKRAKREAIRRALTGPGAQTCTAEVSERICGALRIGMPAVHAAMLAGVAEAQFYRWLAEGKKREPGDPRRDFYDAVGVAMRTAEGRALQKLAQAEDWRASAWLLERRWPASYGPRQTVDIGQARPIESEEEAEQRRAALRAALEDGDE